MKRVTAFVLAFLLSLAVQQVQAQFVVSDPMHTGVSTLIKLIQDPSFKQIVNQIEDLQRVASAVRQFHRGMETVKTVQNTIAKMTKLSAAVSKDGHIFPAEYALMTQDIEGLAAAGSAIFKDMHTATTQSGGVLKMTDAERVAFIDNAYKRVSEFSRVVDAYFAKIRAMSIQRSGNMTDLNNTTKLYALAATVSNNGVGGEIYRNTRDLAYDMGYDDEKKSVLDSAYNSPAAKALREKQQLCSENLQNYYDELYFRESQMDQQSFLALMQEGYSYKDKPQSVKKTVKNLLTFNLNLTGKIADEIDKMTGAADNEVNIQEEIENNIQNFYDPSGKVISNEEFQMLMKIKARELMRPVREELRKKWKLDECMSLGY